MTKYKVGDKVRAVNASRGWGSVGKGDIGVITGVDTDGDYLVKFDSQDGWAAIDADLKLVSNKPTKNQRITALEQTVAELQAEVAALKSAQAAPKFVPVTTDNIAVGDKIRIKDVGAISGGSEYWRNGDIVKIIGEDRSDFKVESGRYAHDWYYITKSSELHAVEKAVSE